MEELLDDIDLRLKRRPITLTVICILSWIGNLLLLLFFGNDLIDNHREGLTDLLILLGFVISASGSAAGSILMFVQLRVGFLIYVISQLLYVSIILGIFVFDDSGRHAFEVIMTFLMTIVPSGFVILYNSQKAWFNSR